jgi:hypothetical protein
VGVIRGINPGNEPLAKGYLHGQLWNRPVSERVGKYLCIKASNAMCAFLRIQTADPLPDTLGLVPSYALGGTISTSSFTDPLFDPLAPNTDEFTDYSVIFSSENETTAVFLDLQKLSDFSPSGINIIAAYETQAIGSGFGRVYHTEGGGIPVLAEYAQYLAISQAPYIPSTPNIKLSFQLTLEKEDDPTAFSTEGSDLYHSKSIKNLGDRELEWTFNTYSDFYNPTNNTRTSSNNIFQLAGFNIDLRSQKILAIPCYPSTLSTYNYPIDPPSPVYL